MTQNNNRWISQNFGNLVDLYGGRYVAVVNRKVVAVGKTHALVEKRAKAAGGSPGGRPAVVRVPEQPIDPIRLFRFS